MYVNVVFVIRCFYSAVSLTLAREQRFIRIIIIQPAITPYLTSLYAIFDFRLRLNLTSLYVLIQLPITPYSNSYYALFNFPLRLNSTSHYAIFNLPLRLILASHYTTFNFPLRLIQLPITPYPTSLYALLNVHVTIMPLIRTCSSCCYAGRRS